MDGAKEFAEFQSSLQAQKAPVPRDEAAAKAQDQDAQLASLLGSVQRQKHLAVCINNELDAQNALVSEMSADTQATERKMKKQQSSLERLLKRFF